MQIKSKISELLHLYRSIHNCFILGRIQHRKGVEKDPIFFELNGFVLQFQSVVEIGRFEEGIVEN